MDGTGKGMEYLIAKDRLETLIDGIFAIAMTLLVLTITIDKPTPEEAPAVLPGILWGLLPQILTLTVAFIVIAVFWQVHNRQFHFVRAVDPVHLWIIIFMLIAIVLVPFSTDISGDYPNVGVAALLFNLNIFAAGLMIALHWRYISIHPQLCCPLPELRVMKIWSWEVALIPAVALVAVFLSFVTPVGSLLVYLFTPFAWFFLHRHPQQVPVSQP
jgi:uncharacterized membrane protein